MVKQPINCYWLKKMKPIFLPLTQTKRVCSGHRDVQKMTSKVKPTQQNVPFLKAKRNCITCPFHFADFWTQPHELRYNYLILSSSLLKKKKKKRSLALQKPTIKTKWSKPYQKAYSPSNHPTRDLKGISMLAVCKWGGWNIQTSPWRFSTCFSFILAHSTHTETSVCVSVTIGRPNVCLVFFS